MKFQLTLEHKNGGKEQFFDSTNDSSQKLHCDLQSTTQESVSPTLKNKIVVCYRNRGVSEFEEGVFQSRDDDQSNLSQDTESQSRKDPGCSTQNKNDYTRSSSRTDEFVGLSKSDGDIEKWSWHLLAQICSGNLPAVMEIIESSEEFFQDFALTRFETGRSILIFAVIKNSEKLIDVLLKKCPQLISMTDLYGNGPLHYAIQYNKLISFHKLLKLGADPNAKQKQGMSCLHLAAIKNQQDMFLTLLCYHADTSLQDNYGLEPLCYMKDIVFISRIKSIAHLHNQKYELLEPPLKKKHFVDRKRTYMSRLGLINLPAQEPLSINNYSYEDRYTKSQDVRLGASQKQRDTSNSGLTSVDSKTTTTSDFVIEDLIGQGSFGEIYCAKKVDTGKLYAIKTLSKRQVLCSRLSTYLQTEKKVLMNFTHPFLVRLHSCFQNDKKLFMVIDYCEKGDLGKMLKHSKRIPEHKLRILLAELILGIQSLHDHGILHRDIKPENVLIDKEGHIKLTDFGFSKELEKSKLTASSFCGSLIYLPPEMVSRKEHDFSIDWYLLGQLAYECLTGSPPFYDKSKERMMYRIMNEELRMPTGVSEDIWDIVSRLMNKSTGERLGSRRGGEEIKEHPFFLGLDWKRVAAKDYPLFGSSDVPSYGIRHLNLPIDSHSCRYSRSHLSLWSFCE